MQQGIDHQSSKIVAEDSPDSLQARLSGAQRVIVQVRAATLEDIKRITGNIEGLSDNQMLTRRQLI